MPELLLALDAGTTTLRACVFTPGGDMVGRAAEAVATNSPAPGRVEQDAEAIWQGARRVMQASLGAWTFADVAAIGITSQRASAVLWDRRDGRPLTPLVSWSDLRGAARADELRARGYPLSPQQSAAKLEAMVASIANARALIAAGRLAFGNVDAFLAFRLTGRHATDRTQAWPSGYLDLFSHGWNSRLLEEQQLDASIFPELVDTWGVVGETDPAEFGAHVALSAIVADQQAALIGHGGEAAGAAKVTYGTSATLNVSTGDQFVYRGGALPPFILAHLGGQAKWCLEAMVYSAGSALDWLRATFHLGDHAAFAAFLGTAPDAGGVALLPAFQGLGAPHADLARRAAITGLSLAAGPGQIARAGIEGVAFRVREAFDAAFAGGDVAPPDDLPVDGGLTASEALMQAQADLLARPVKRHAHREATAAGAALCAARGVGLVGPAETAGFARYDRTFEPGLSADEAAARLAAWRSAVGIAPLP